MKGNCLEAVMFDWDGTLYDSLLLNYNCYLKVFSRFGIKAISIEEYRSRATPNWYEFYRYLQIPEDKWLEADEIWLAQYEEERSKGKLFPDCISTLEYLKANGLKIGLVSAGNKSRVLRDIEAQGVMKFFDTMIFGDEVDFEKRKPAPYQLEIALENLGISASKSLYVGDMIEDILMGKNAGTKTAVVLTGFATPEKLRSVSPDFMLENLSEIRDII
ncbi:MAG: HAD-IIIA family hydrolase [Methanocellales archaeon]